MQFLEQLFSAPDERTLWDQWDAHLQDQNVVTCNVIYEQGGQVTTAHSFGSGAILDAVPLRYNGQTFGKVEIDQPQTGEWQNVVDQLALALVNQRRFQLLGKQASAADNLRRCIQEISDLFGNTKVKALLPKLLQASLQIASAEIGAIVTSSTPRQCLELGINLDWLESIHSGEDNMLEVWFSSANHAYYEGADLAELSWEGDFNLDNISVINLHTGRTSKGLIIFVNSAQGYNHAAHEALSTISRLMALEIEHTQERERAEQSAYHRHELQIARALQMQLQAAEYTEHGGLTVATMNLSCDETGGDYVDVVPLTDYCLDLVVGDATGHGLGGAMIMVNARAGLKSLMETDHTLPQVFYMLNNRLEADTSDNHFMTMLLARIDSLSKSVSFISAGHDPALLWRKRTNTVEQLDACGIPLGMLPDQDYPLDHKAGLESGDILLMFTDGLPEAHSPSGDLLGTEPVVELMIEHQFNSVAHAVQSIRELVLNHVGKRKRMDDITVLAARID